MTFVTVTESDRGTGNGETGEGRAPDPLAGPRAGARTRKIVASLAAITQRVRAPRVAEPVKAGWQPRNLPVDLGGDAAAVEVPAVRSWWVDGPMRPAEVWARYRGWIEHAEGRLLTAAVVLFGILPTVLGIAGAALTLVTQRLGVAALVAVVAVVMAGGWLADTPTVPPGTAAVTAEVAP